MEERVHPIPFRTRQLSSPSSMILRILTWESRTTPRLLSKGRLHYGAFPFLCPQPSSISGENPSPLHLLPIPFFPFFSSSFFFSSSSSQFSPSSFLAYLCLACPMVKALIFFSCTESKCRLRILYDFSVSPQRSPAFFVASLLI